MLVDWFSLSRASPSFFISPLLPHFSLSGFLPLGLGWSCASAWRGQSWNREHKSASPRGLRLEWAASLCSIFLGLDLFSLFTSWTQLSPMLSSWNHCFSYPILRHRELVERASSFNRSEAHGHWREVNSHSHKSPYFDSSLREAQLSGLSMTLVSLWAILNLCSWGESLWCVKHYPPADTACHGASSWELTPSTSPVVLKEGKKTEFP